MTDDEMKRKSNFHVRGVLEKLTPEIPPEDLILTWNKMTSLIVVRNPMDRLVSLYNNKFIKKSDKSMLWMTDFIIDHYREKGGEGDPNTVMPEELVRYCFQLVIIGTLKSKAQSWLDLNKNTIKSNNLRFV